MTTNTREVTPTHGICRFIVAPALSRMLAINILRVKLYHRNQPRHVTLAFFRTFDAEVGVKV